MFALFIFGIALLSALSLFILYRSWSRIASDPSANKAFDASQSAPVACPPGVDASEWALLVQKRDEIEQDPLIDESTRETLRQQWFLSAEQVFHRGGGQGLQIISDSTPVSAKWLILLTLLIASVTYVFVGEPNPGALTLAAPVGVGRSDDRIPSGSDRHPGGEVAMEDRIRALEARLAQEPDNLAGWALLSRAKASQKDFAGSVLALEKALALAPGHPDILADLADMVAMTQDRKMAGRALDYVSQALKSDPDHEKALALAATAAEQANDKPTAERYWARLKAVQNNRAQADLMAGNNTGAPSVPAGAGPAAQGAPVAPGAGASQSASGGAEAIVGRVTLNDDFRRELSKRDLPPNAALYIVAKPLTGPPMPLAVMRVPAAQLKASGSVDFRLDDSLAMAPQMKLSGQEKVNVEARLSFGGQANRASGDWSKTLGGVKPGEQGVKLVIDTVVP
jgi:cytochrome c-type biogenesis protein CcmH